MYAKTGHGRKERHKVRDEKKVGWQRSLLIDCLNDLCSAEYAVGLELIIAY